MDTSEIQLEEPIGYTCPDIDKLLKVLSTAQNELAYVQRILGGSDCSDSAVTDAISLVSSIESDIDISRELENIRRANQTLRDWGILLSNYIKDSK